MTDNPEAPLLVAPIAKEASDRARAVRVGVVALVAIAVFAFALLVTGPLQVVSGPRLRVDFAFCGPIKPGASVRLAGVVVGVVEDVDLLAGADAEAGADKMVRVRIRVEQRVRHLLTTEARFYVTTLGVLGEHYLDIAPAAGGTLLGDDARVDGATLARADLLLPRASALLDKADALLPSSPELRALLSATTSLVTTLSEILASDGTQRALAGDADELRGLLRDVRALVRSANTGLGDGAPLKATLTLLPPVLERAQTIEEQLVAKDLGATLSAFQAVATRADRLIARLEEGPAADPAAQRRLVDELTVTLRSLDAAARRAERVLAVVDDKKGAGALLHDDAFAADVKAVVKTVRDDPMRLLFK